MKTSLLLVVLAGCGGAIGPQVDASQPDASDVTNPLDSGPDVWAEPDTGWLCDYAVAGCPCAPGAGGTCVVSLYECVCGSSGCWWVASTCQCDAGRCQ